MKWLGGTIAGVFLGFFFIIMFVMYKSGSFKSVSIEKASVGPYVAVYKNRLGAYHESSATLIQIEELLKENNFLCIQSFGLYIDDPNQVDAERLRSELGCLFDEKFKTPLEKLISEKNLDLNIKYLDTKNYVVGTFEGSPALVSLKVYPKIKEWAQQQRYTLKTEALEIYEIKTSDKVKTSVLFEIL
jgi:effector-binding domain-containing protein